MEINDTGKIVWDDKDKVKIVVETEETDNGQFIEITFCRNGDKCTTSMSYELFYFLLFRENIENFG